MFIYSVSYYLLSIHSEYCPLRSVLKQPRVLLHRNVWLCEIQNLIGSVMSEFDQWFAIYTSLDSSIQISLLQKWILICHIRACAAYLRLIVGMYNDALLLYNFCSADWYDVWVNRELEMIECQHLPGKICVNCQGTREWCPSQPEYRGVGQAGFRYIWEHEIQLRFTR